MCPLAGASSGSVTRGSLLDFLWVLVSDLVMRCGMHEDRLAKIDSNREGKKEVDVTPGMAVPGLTNMEGHVSDHIFPERIRAIFSWSAHNALFTTRCDVATMQRPSLFVSRSGKMC